MEGEVLGLLKVVCGSHKTIMILMTEARLYLLQVAAHSVNEGKLRPYYRLLQMNYNNNYYFLIYLHHIYKHITILNI